MISRAIVSDRPNCARVRGLATVACAVLALILGATGPAAASGACPNEGIRRESNINPVSGEPYSVALPDCRAYEMVSPLYKQGHDVSMNASGGIGFPAAPDGDTVAFVSEGDFASPENYQTFENPYLSQRGATEWLTSSTFAPRSLVDETFQGGIRSDSSLNMRSVRVSCGAVSANKAERNDERVACAVREPDGSWVATRAYGNLGDIPNGLLGTLAYRGGSSDLSRVFIQPPASLLPEELPLGNGIYEIAGMGTPAPFLRLVNVDNAGKELALLGGEPLLGGWGTGTKIEGTTYHAISKSGGTVFFSADNETPKVQAVYARVSCGTTAQHSSAPTCKEYPEHGNGEWFETVSISQPSEKDCKPCYPLKGVPRAAVFQGASADGSKAFFTTKQPLLTKDESTNLYEYDFSKPEGERLMLLSNAEPITPTALVQGVVRNSPDGSHIYFVAFGVLTEKANGNEEKAEASKPNLYGYDTATAEIKFVAKTSIAGVLIEKEPEKGINYSPDVLRHAQTTPDGRYLVFSSNAQLEKTGDTNTKGCNEGHCPQAVYRYDFQTGELTWISHEAGAGLAAPNEGKDALVAPLPGGEIGAYVNADNWDRAISGCPVKGVRSEGEESEFNCPEGKYDGEDIVFISGERLAPGDVTSAVNVYEWHNGTVSMISDGIDPNTIETQTIKAFGVGATMSASGSDIYFFTHTRLVGQDTDVLTDLYDARMNREGGMPDETGKELAGFVAPRPDPSCSGDACQPPPSPAPSFSLAASSLFTGGRNLTPGSTSVSPSTQSKAPKQLTRAQRLAKALKACKKKPKRKRRLCEAQARKKYGPKASRKAKSHARGR